MATDVGNGRTPKTGAARVARELRTARILEWRLAGHSLATIATEEKISVSRVAQIIEAELAARKAAALTSLRRMEAERLDSLQAAVWTRASEGGELMAVETILKIMARRARLLGLDAPMRLEGESVGNGDAAREQLAAKLLKLVPELPAPAGFDGKMIDGIVEPEPGPYLIGKPAEVATMVMDDLPEPDPLADLANAEDLYGEAGLFSR